MQNPWNYVKHLEAIRTHNNEKQTALSNLTNLVIQVSGLLRWCEIASTLPEFIQNIQDYSFQNYEKFKTNINHFFKKKLREEQIEYLWLAAAPAKDHSQISRNFPHHCLVEIERITAFELATLRNPALEQSLKKIDPDEKKRGIYNLLREVDKEAKKLIPYIESQRTFLLNRDHQKFRGSNQDDWKAKEAFFHALDALKHYTRRSIVKGIFAAGAAAITGNWGKRKIIQDFKVQEPDSDHPRIANLPLKKLVDKGIIQSLIPNRHLSIGRYNKKNSTREVIIIAEEHTRIARTNAKVFIKSAIRELNVDALGFENHFGPPRPSLFEDARKAYTERIGTTKIDLSSFGGKFKGKTAFESPSDIYRDLLLQGPLQTLQGKKVIPSFGIDTKEIWLESCVLGMYLQLLDLGFSFDRIGLSFLRWPKEISSQLVEVQNNFLERNPSSKMPPLCIGVLAKALGNYTEVYPIPFHSAHRKYHHTSKKQCSYCETKFPKKKIRDQFRLYQEEITKLIAQGEDEWGACGLAYNLLESKKISLLSVYREIFRESRKTFEEFHSRIFKLAGVQRNIEISKNIVKYMEHLGSRRAIIVIGVAHVDKHDETMPDSKLLGNLLPYTSLIVYAK